MDYQPYGYELAPELHRQLRGTALSDALRWVEAECGATVVGQRPLVGGTSSAVHLLTLRSGRGAERDVVLRRYVLDWVLEEPWAPGNEAMVLDLLRTAGPAVPAPDLLAADLDGRHCGAPAVLMSTVPGRVVWEPTDLESWLRRLAEVLPRIHALPVSPRLSEWAPYPPAGSNMPPTWTGQRAAWETAISCYHGERPSSDRVFLHRDYHPGNVLWTDGVVSGLVDWVSSCAGPPEEDVAHCRANLATCFGQSVADRFLHLWQRVSGRDDYHPYWDLTTVISFEEDHPVPRLDDFVAAAAARLG